MSSESDLTRIRTEISRPSETPIRDAALRADAGVDVVVDAQKVEGRARVDADTPHGRLTVGAAVRKWYDGALEYFGFASWRPRRKR